MSLGLLGLLQLIEPAGERQYVVKDCFASWIVARNSAKGPGEFDHLAVDLLDGGIWEIRNNGLPTCPIMMLVHGALALTLLCVATARCNPISRGAFQARALIERSFYRLYFVISYGQLLSGASMILLVEDNPNARLLFAPILSSAGHEVVESENGEEAVSLLEEHRIDLVVTD